MSMSNSEPPRNLLRVLNEDPAAFNCGTEEGFYPLVSAPLGRLIRSLEPKGGVRS
jgi:hypothetical protein